MKNYFTNLIALLLLFSSAAVAQVLPDGFDMRKAYQEAKDKGIPANDIDGYVRFLHNDYLTHKGSHNHTTVSNNAVYDMGTIYKGYGNPSANKPSTPNTPQNQYCPNAGFEQFNFSNWTGGYGQVVTGASTAAFPSYNQTAASIVSPAGMNAPLANTSNYHTVMTTPATNSIYPNCVGYDSIACKVVGTQTVAEIPVVNPTGGPSSVRMNGANANYRACKLNYNMALNPNNKSFSISYALVLENGGHLPYEQPYFSVKVTDQNGNLVPGCSVYTVTCSDQLTDPTSPLYDPTWTDAVIGFGIMYRKWSTYAFDFSNYPTVTSVNVEFYVGGCSQSGHFGYAYVDAECSQGGAVASFCAGSNASVLTAPGGYASYQWIGPSGPISVANGGNTPTATISPVTAGQVFTCNVTSQNGCFSSFQTTVAITTISITGVSSIPSCQNGNSGSANVAATGSSMGYSYQWLNSSGSTVGNSQNATGLSPGTYSVIVSSPMCGSATATVAVGITPPLYYALNAPYCGSVAWITNSGGSNYKWYTASPLALISGANSSSLTINNPVNGAQYYLSYTTASGCKDSILYTLDQTTGGSIYVSNVKSICPGNNNSYAVVNLQTAAPPVYSYTVTGPGGYNSVLANTSAIKDSVTNLSIGTYSAVVFDGQCLYNTTFTVSPFTFSYTLTPTTSTICTSGSTSLTVNFGNTTPSACGLSSTGACTSPNQITVGTGANANTSTSYPSIYGHFYRNARHQMLYTAAELLAAGVVPGKISSLAFMVNSIPSGYIGSLPGLTIKLKCTPSTNVTSVFDNTGLVQVYTVGSYAPVVGWNVHNFATPYEWDGVSSLLVDVCYTLNSNISWTTNPLMPYTTTPVNRCVYDQDDSSPLCGQSGFPTATTDRPNIKFYNCGGSNPAAFNYTWTPTTGLNPTNTYTTIANPAATTVYTVMVEPIGQTNCLQAQTATVNVVNPVTPTITAVPAMCSNAAQVTMTVTPSGGSWLGSGMSSAGVLTPSAAVIGTNTYSYALGSGTCAASNTVAISIERFVPSTITGSINPLCITSPVVNLSTALSTSTLGAGTWSGNGVSGTAFDPAVAGAGLHTIVYSTNSVPTVSLCPSTSSINVSVSSVTQPTITAAGPYCDNFAPQVLSVTPTGGVWSSTTTATDITASGVFTPANSLIGSNKVLYTLTSGPCVAKDSIIVDVVKFVPATISGLLGPYCIYDPMVSLQPIAQYTGGVWSGNGVTGSDFTPAIAGAGLHTITYNTDPAPAGLCPDQATTQIIVNAKPEANAVPNIIEGCNPLTVNYQTTTVNTGTASWDFGDGNPVETGFMVTHTYTVPGVYTAVLSYTDNVGCLDTTNAASAVTVYSVPVAAFEANPDITTVVDGEISFQNNTSDLSLNTYQWYFGTSDSSSVVNPTYLYTNSGEFFVTLIATSPEGCLDTAVKKVTINPDVVLYVPNAFTPGNGDGLNDVFEIFLPPTGVDFSTFSLTVYDRWGSIVYKTTDISQFWNGSKNNSGELLKQDVYVYKITFEDLKKKHYEKIGHVSLLRK